MTKLPYPDEILNQHLAILGKTGSGKTYTAKGAVEHLLDAGRRVCVVDPTGVWYGLRLKSDGVKSAYPVVIFGGTHADIPLEARHGKKLAEIVAKESFSCIIDTKLLPVDERTAFFTDFAEGLLRLNRRPLHLVIDEAHIFAPQQKLPSKASARLAHATNNLVSGGRASGFRIMLVSQRAAKLHKDSLTQVNTLIALKLMAPQDVGAVKAWIKEWASAQDGEKVVSSLPSLNVGEGWVWAPEHGLLKKLNFPKIKTFDSSRAPEEGEQAKVVVLAEVDLVAIRNALEPAAAAKKAVPAPIVTVAPQSRVDTEKLEFDAYHRGRSDAMREAREAFAEFLLDLDGAKPDVLLPNGQLPKPVFVRQPRAEIPVSVARQVASSGDQKLGGPEKTMLNAIVFWHAKGFEAPTRAQVAAIAGWRVTAGHFTNIAGKLRSAGYIDYPTPGTVALTVAGREIAEPPSASKTVLQSLRDFLSGPQQAVIDALPQDGELPREELAERLGWSASAGHLTNILGSLRSLQVIDYPSKGRVATESWIYQ